MKRAKRMDGVAGFGIDQVAAAITDPDVLRLENLDTDLPLPPEAVRVTREALEDPVSNSSAPVHRGHEPARGDLRPHRAAPTAVNTTLRARSWSRAVAARVCSTSCSRRSTPATR